MNVNKVLLVGRLAADPETRSTQSGQQVATLRLATNRVWNDKNGQKQEQVEFHSIVAWGSLADIASRYLKKGQLAYIEGRLQTRSWTGKDGAKRYTTEIVAETLQLGPKAMGMPFTGQAPMVKSERKSASAAEDSDIPVIEPDAPLSSPLGKEESNVEEAEIDLKDIPF